MTSVDNPKEEAHGLSFLRSDKRTWVYEKRFLFWVLTWGIVTACCKYLIKNEFVVEPLNWAVALLPVFFALIPLRAYYRFFTHADEMLRKMQVESICISFVVGLFYTIANLMLEDVGLTAADARDVFVIMMYSFGIATAYTAWKYR